MTEGGPARPSRLMWLVLLETSGNQAYIFDTNRRRENVGASHLIASLGEWTIDALVRLGMASRSAVRDARLPTAQAEVLTTAAGRVQVLVTDPEQGRALVAAVTRHALVRAPGLDVCGVVVPFDWTEASTDGPGATGRTLPAATREASGLLPRVRAARPAQPSARFARLPIAEHCRSSSLPAAGLYDVVDVETLRAAAEAGLTEELEEPEPRSAFSRAKLRAVDGARTAGDLGGVESAYDRLAALLLAPGADDELARTWTPGDVPPARRATARRALQTTADHLQSDREWVAVVHADGNGLGEVFLGLGAEIADRSARECADILRDFSAAVEAATVDAYLAAVDELVRLGLLRAERTGRDAALDDPLSRFRAEVLPLILGGDDLTVVCEGKVALAFTAAYLRALEERTQVRLGAVVNEYRLRPERARKLTAKAGVAIVKRSYPFSSAYHLAESLMDEARQVKTRTTGASGLAFHVLYDTAAADLDALRARATLDDGVRLHAQPYVVTRPADGWDGWAARHRWVDLLEQVAALQKPATGREGRALPRSQTHDLRAGLQLGREVADARYRGLRAAAGANRYEGLQALAAPDGTATLFWDDDERPDEPRWVTRYLDAMDAEEFLATASRLHDEAVASGEDAQ
ncbi:hypothetical protein I6A60_05905 [Frankia sp. AgB1.9]|uniref:Cas10/Cmr2 second palm domain-containing protein n=1 Tax=unclassified Frankia TaxID=2632575 RepID=UPI0019319FC6|nr:MULTISPECIES: hypothetical protein [unclassified Frankia]MBL7487452.1 hypothetical protein [Frankia sp. AgW1.1]MBL7547414.1 hypothetical protein [Frankia sp. AgB1.9]MBL7618811.1 hypothetical protein [Frankia sp. AgB1.8]